MKNIISFAILPVLFIISCASNSGITGSWRAPGLSRKEYKKIAVLGPLRETSPSLRKKMEQYIASQLKGLGYNVVCSTEENGTSALKKMDEMQAITKLRETGADAVLTVDLIKKEQEVSYIPNRLSYPPHALHQDHFYGYYDARYDSIYAKGYYVTATKYFWQTKFYDMESGAYIYSVESRVLYPVSIDSLCQKYSQMVVKDMVKRKVVVNHKAP